MNRTLEIKLHLRYEGGEAEQHRLNLYDASRSIKGLSQVLHIICTSLIKDGEVRQKYTPIKNVHFYLESAKKGSFLEMVSIVLDSDVIKTVGISVFSTAFWDMLKYTVKIGTGINAQPETPTVKKIIQKNPDFIDEMISALEKPLGELQRPIETNSNITMNIERPRVGIVAKLNKDTLDYVLRDPDYNYETEIIGNVTRFNAVTLNGGRFYSDSEARIIPFTLGDNLTKLEQVLLTESLHRFNDDIACKVSIDAQVVKDRIGRIKRYIIEKVERQF